MGWYCKECDDWFAFGYSKKYCSEDCYDEKEERKERKRERRRAEAQQEENLRQELSNLKLSFQSKWNIEYTSHSTDAPQIKILIKREKALDKEIEELKVLAKEIDLT